MNTEQAKFILSAYRADGCDANDPQFTGALEQLKHDPELARWFEEERELDQAFGRKFREAARPPAELKAKLMACTVVIHPLPWWKRPRTWAAAALLLISLGLAGAWLNRSTLPGVTALTSLTTYRQEMGEFLQRPTSPLQHVSRNVASVKQWLQEQNAHADFHLPPGLTDQPSLGCGILSWRAHQVSLICFNAQNQTVHLFVIDRTHLDAPPRPTPLYAQVGSLATATWSEGNKTYLLATKADEQLLTQLL